MPSPRSALLFAAKFVALVTLLLVPWRWLGTVHSLAFSLAATTALEAVVDAREHVMRFEPVSSDADPQPGREWEVRFTSADVATREKTTLPINARDLGYVPFATLAALVVAAPYGGRRRRQIALRGGAFLAARLGLAVGLPIAHRVGALGAWAELPARVAFWALIDPPDMMYASPVVAFAIAVLLTAPPAASAAPLVPAAPV